MAKTGDGAGDDPGTSPYVPFQPSGPTTEFLLAPEKPTSYPAQPMSLHSCALCPERFISTTDLREHFETDHPQCLYCRAKQLNQDSLKSHIKHWHPSCAQCQKRFRTSALLQQHKNERLVCTVCSTKKVFCTPTVFTRHQQKYHIKCASCGLWVSDSAAYAKHKDTIHPTCSYCQETFNTEALYSSHFFGCEVCQETTWWCNKDELARHQKREHIKCSYCKNKRLLENDEKYMAHKEEAHPECPHCSRRYGTNRELREHIARHPARQPPRQIDQSAGQGRFGYARPQGTQVPPEGYFAGRVRKPIQFAQR
jgi:hypothetical protein